MGTPPGRQPDQAAHIDVLIPAYNAEGTIVSAVQSIQAQTVQDLRIIVLNDGSTDGTGALLHTLAEEDPRILVIDRPNGGIVSARNALLKRSSAPIVATLDADDVSLPDRLACQLAYLQAHPDCVAVGVNAWYIDEHGRRTGGHSQFGGDARADPRALPTVEPYLINAFVMMRREAVLAVGGYRHAVNAEDTDLYWRLLSQGRLHNLGAVLGEVRMTTASASSSSAHGGRISAVHSQLAAISYLRRAEGRADVPFPQERSAAMWRLPSLDAIVDCVAPCLTAAEADFLRVASAAKLLELASYRPYLLDVSDCRAIGRALPRILKHRLRPGRIKLVYQRAHILARLLRYGRWPAAMALGSPVSLMAIPPALTARRIKAGRQTRKQRARARSTG